MKVLSRCDFGASITDHLCVQVDSAHCLCVARCSNVFQTPQTRISLQFRYPQPRRQNHGVSRPLPLPHRARTVGPHAASEIVCAASQASPAASETGARTAPTCMVKGPPQEAVRAQAALGAVGGGPSVPPPTVAPTCVPTVHSPPPSVAPTCVPTVQPEAAETLYSRCGARCRQL